MKDTSIRRIETLRLIPRAPHWITASELVTKLDGLDHLVSQRTIQRDLVELSTIFPLDYEVNGRTHCWRWSSNAEVLDLPGMNPETALSFFLAEQYLYEMLPPAAIESLAPHFDKAREVLHQSQSKKVDRWIDKVRILPETQYLLPPLLKRDVIESIYTALLESKPFSARYRKKGDKNRSSYEVINPLGLVFRYRVVYLVATLWKYDDPIQFALHRFSSVTFLDDQKIHKPKNFNLDQYIDSGNFDYREGGDIKIELLFSKEAALHLDETPLSRDQELSNTQDERVRLTATVRNTDRLRWWLRGFGHLVEVISPSTLRNEFIELTKLNASLYRIEE
ncbi:MAG: WYL domain-containing protein [Gammaproteobacteria bacterium]|nr:WYL domain-containing protein [Gammaproteobacteria bacterium]